MARGYRRLGCAVALGFASLGLAAPAGAQGVPQPAPFTWDGAQYTSVPIDQALSGDYSESAL